MKKNLLILHGALGSTKQMFPLYEVLKDDFEIYLINFTGHGGEPIPEEPFSIKMFAGDVIKWLEKTKTESIDIFGYSMGGYVGLYLAKHYPYLVNRLFTLGTKFDWNEESSKKESGMLDPKKIEEKVPKFAEELKARHASEDWKKVLEKTAEMMINLGKENEVKCDELETIYNNILIGLGEKDNMVTLDETVNVYKKLSSGQLLVMQDVPHPIEKVPVDRLAEEIRIFFNKKEKKQL